MKLKQKVSERLAGISWIDADGGRHAVTVREIPHQDGPHIQIVAPSKNEMPVVDVYLFAGESRVYVWTLFEEQLNQIKEQIFCLFHDFSDMRLVETRSKKHASIKEFYCKILH